MKLMPSSWPAAARDAQAPPRCHSPRTVRAWICSAVCCGIAALPPALFGRHGAQDSRESNSASKVRQIIAHRGSSADRPENTRASALRAIEAQATAIEVDVRFTQDKHLVLLHDATLDRTTDGHGAVAERRLQQIRQLDAGAWFAAEFRGERVPTLTEILQLCRGKIDILLDLKENSPEYVDAVTREILRHAEPRRVIVGVRSVEQARAFRKRLPQARQLGLIPNPESIEAFAQAGVETIRLWPKWLQDRSLVERVRTAGAQLHLNGATGQADEVLPLLAWQPDSLSSDDPARLIKTLGELAEQRR